MAAVRPRKSDARHGWPAITARRAEALTTARGPMADLGSRRKVHLAMDTAPGDIRAHEFALSHEGNGALCPALWLRSRTLRASRCVTAIEPVMHAAALMRPLRDEQAQSSRPPKWTHVESLLSRANLEKRAVASNTPPWAALGKKWSRHHASSRVKAQMTLQVHSRLWCSPARPQAAWRSDRVTKSRSPDGGNAHPHPSWPLSERWGSSSCPAPL